VKGDSSLIRVGKKGANCEEGGGKRKRSMLIAPAGNRGVQLSYKIVQRGKRRTSPARRGEKKRSCRNSPPTPPDASAAHDVFQKGRSDLEEEGETEGLLQRVQRD